MVFVGNVCYKDDKQDIVVDEIVYDVKQEIYFICGCFCISDLLQLLEVDQVDYSEEWGIGIVIGFVIWWDIFEDLIIMCDMADYDWKVDYFKVFGGCNGWLLFIMIVDGDFLFMVFDILLVL